MDTTDLNCLAWRKSSYSSAGNDCVEVADLPSGAAAVRDSMNPNDGVLVFNRSQWHSFLAGLRAERLG